MNEFQLESRPKCLQLTSLLDKKGQTTTTTTTAKKKQVAEKTTTTEKKAGCLLLVSKKFIHGKFKLPFFTSTKMASHDYYLKTAE